MILLKDYTVKGIYAFLKNDKQADELIELGFNDEDVIKKKLKEQYPSNNYHVVLDYIDDDEDGHFRIRVWIQTKIARCKT